MTPGLLISTASGTSPTEAKEAHERQAVTDQIFAALARPGFAVIGHARPVTAGLRVDMTSALRR